MVPNIMEQVSMPLTINGLQMANGSLSNLCQICAIRILMSVSFHLMAI